MNSKPKTHITQFSWRVPGRDRLKYYSGWEDLVSSCRTGRFKAAGVSGMSLRTFQRVPKSNRQLPGRFPGSVEYVSSRSLGCRKIRVQRLAKPTDSRRETPSSAWCYRSE
jgi:hypothetical protein